MAIQFEAPADNDARDAAPAPDVTGQILLIPTGEIDMGERLRPVDKAWACALGQIMTRDGQLTPIEVCRLPGKSRWTLVSGAHRLTGAGLAGIAYLRAIEVTSDRAERRLREVSENLWRSNLAPLDRATFVAELVGLQKLRMGVDPAKDGRAASAAARWQKEIAADADDAKLTMSVAYGWTDIVAESLGISAATVKRDMLLYRRLTPSEIERLRAAHHPALTNAGQLAALAKLDAGERAVVLDLMIDGGARTVAEAQATLLQRKAPTAEEKRFNAFFGAWGRMSLSEQKGALDRLLAMAPRTLRDQARDTLNSAPDAKGAA